MISFLGFESLCLSTQRSCTHVSLGALLLIAPALGAQEAASGAAAHVLALGAAIVAPGTEIEPSGPMRFAVPADLCQRELEPMPASPLVGPDTDFEDAEFQAGARAFADARYLHEMRARLCTPVYVGAHAAAVWAQEPACGVPPEPEAVVSPEHPLLDRTQLQAITAVERHADATQRLQVLQVLCERVARAIADAQGSGAEGSP